MSCRIVFNRSFVSVLWIRVKVVCHRRNMREVASSRRPFDYIFSHLRHAEQPDSVSGSYGDVIGHTYDLDQGPHDKAMRSHSSCYKR